MITETIVLEKKEFDKLAESVSRYLDVLVKTSAWTKNKNGFWQTTITVRVDQ